MDYQKSELNTVSIGPLVWINGYPGTGKLTIAREIMAILGENQALLVDNHQLIDPVEIELAQSDPEMQDIRSHPQYQTKRKSKREAAFQECISDVRQFHKTVFFTGIQCLT